MKSQARAIVSVFLFLLAAGVSAAETKPVELLRTPDSGIQPQAVVDSQGTVHLIYYKGESGAGDIFYIKRAASASEFSKPIQVNSQRGSAIAAGSIRGAQLAVGKNGRVHVAWDGMGKGATKANIAGASRSPSDSCTGLVLPRCCVNSVCPPKVSSAACSRSTSAWKSDSSFLC